MKCYCCDKDLSDKEVVYNPELPGWEMCNTCLDISMEAAYGQRYDNDTVEVIDPEWDDPSDLVVV